jgi:hypothetical protein
MRHGCLCHVKGCVTTLGTVIVVMKGKKKKEQKKRTEEGFIRKPSLKVNQS